jgi:tight adherence protein B
MGTVGVVLVAAVCLAGGATLVLAPPRPRVPAAAPPGVAVGRAGAVARPSRRLVVVAATAVGVPLLLAEAPSWLVPSVGAMAGVVALVVAERRRSAARVCALATAEQVDEAVTAMTAALAAGASPAQTLGSAARASPTLFDEAARRAQWGVDPTPALRHAAQQPGAGSLTELAAAWAVAASTGCRLLDVLERLRTSVHDGVAVAHEVQEQIAPVRATARVLALLPLGGVVVGGSLGVNVPRLLLTTTWGHACIAAALALVASGLWLVERIARRAER